MAVLLNGTNGLIQAYDYQTPATGFSYTFAAGTQTLVMNPAATLANGTITMPASPSDGMTITISSSKKITALTLNGNTGQTIVGGVTSLAANQTMAYVYRSANTSWFPMQSVISQPLGVDQTWTDVTASRALGTTYTNTTGRPIQVGATVYPSTAGAAYGSFSVNGTSIAIVGQFSGVSPNTNGGTLVSPVIPSGATYSFATAAGTMNIYSWWELR